MSRRARESLESLNTEIRDHLLREAEENIRRGMPPDEAHRAARRAFGNPLLIQEAARAVWIPLWWDQFIHDLRHGLHLCVRAPGFSTVVVLALALGIGLNTAVFSVFNAVLVRPLSYPNPDRLAWIAPVDDRGHDDVVMSPDFVAWRDHATVFDGLAGFMTAAEPVDVGDEVVQARVAAVTDGFWDLAGATFSLGGPPPRGQEGIVLSFGFFEHQFHADPAVIGRPVLLNGRETVVTGVLPPHFRPQLASPPALLGTMAGDIDVYRANVLPASGESGIRILNVIGQVKPGITFERARVELETLRQRPGAPGKGTRVAAPLRVVGYADKLVGDSRKPLIILQAAVAVLLLIVCVNTANLLLVRGSARQREIAIRSAIGAGRARVLRQFFVESLLLGATGSAAGLLVAQGVTVLMVRHLPLAVPRLSEATFDARVLVFALGAGLLTTLVFALVPAIAGWKTNIYEALTDGARSASSSRRGARTRSALVIIEVALTMVLLVAAGLIVKSFWRMTAHPPGFTPD